MKLDEVADVELAVGDVDPPRLTLVDRPEPVTVTRPIPDALLVRLRALQATQYAMMEGCALASGIDMQINDVNFDVDTALITIRPRR
jgi:hypothetical protein